MADTYEKDLAQKSTLTTSDYIRVVGSDNVSYKQLVSSVMGAFKVSRTSVANSTDFDSLGYDATLGSAYYRGTNISTMTNRPSAETNAFPWALDVINIDGYVKQILHVYSASGTIKVYERQQYYSSGSHPFASWEAMPTRAEVDALTNSTAGHSLSANGTVTITLSKYFCAGTLYGAVNNNLGFEYAYGNGYLAPIKTATGVTVTIGSDYKTITVTNSTTTNGWVGMSVTNGATVTTS